MKRLMIIGLWPDDVVKYCTEKCECRRYAFDRIIYHRGGRAARERICIPVVDRSGAVTTYLDLPVTLLEAGVVYLRLDDGSDIFLSDTQMVLIANEVERRRERCEEERTMPEKSEFDKALGELYDLTEWEDAEAAIRELHARGPEIERLYLDSKILPGELRALVMVSNCLEREFIHRQLATGQPLHMNVL